MNKNLKLLSGLFLLLSKFLFIFLMYSKLFDLSASAECDDLRIPRYLIIKGIDENTDEKIRSLKIDLGDPDINEDILCSVYSNNCWTNYVSCKDIIRNNERNSFIEAVKIKLKGKLEKNYNIYYRSVVEAQGQLGWARNGEICGCMGTGLAIKELEVRLTEKNFKYDFLRYIRPPAIIRIPRGNILNNCGGRSKTLKIKTNEGTKFFKYQEIVSNQDNVVCWNYLIGNKGKEFFDSKIRNVATKRIAELLEIKNLVANCQMVTVKKIGEPDADGLWIDEANGIDFWRFKESGNKNIMPSFVKDLYNLEVLDGICSQLDRCPWNYSIIRSLAGDPVHLVGYDNDLSFGTINDLTRFRYWGCFLINGDGQVNLPHMDKNLANKILSLTDEHIEAALFDILDPPYVESTKNRVNQVKKAIEKTILYRKDFLLDNWNDSVIEDDRTFPAFTYLKLFRERVGY